MKVYKNAIIATGIITLISFLASFIFNFYTQVNSFWCNALLGIFGSSLLTLLTSTIGYRVERCKTFEGFSYATKEILSCSISACRALWLGSLETPCARK